ncbi:MAG TPA: ATP-binding cassette domain-containing protein [Kineosporiaceae bacterium]
MISARHLEKSYGSVHAVRDLSFEVRPGVVTGFLGPNGAGKSTTLRLMLGLDSGGGTTTFGGRRYLEIRRPLHVVGAVLDASAFHPTRTARNHLRMLAASAAVRPERVEEVLGLVGLADAADRRPGGFSLGMGQRLALAAALLGDPQYLILDEPANGLDPEGIHWLRRMIAHLAAEGRCVLVSSHLLAEMAQLADELVVIGRGSLVAAGPVSDFVSRFTQRQAVVRSPQSGWLAGLLRQGGVGPVSLEPDGSLLVAGAELAQIGEIAGRHGVILHELSERVASLEEAFLAATAGAAEYRAGPGQAGPDHPARPVTGVAPV